MVLENLSFCSEKRKLKILGLLLSKNFNLILVGASNTTREKFTNSDRINDELNNTEMLSVVFIAQVCSFKSIICEI